MKLNPYEPTGAISRGGAPVWRTVLLWLASPIAAFCVVATGVQLHEWNSDPEYALPRFALVAQLLFLPAWIGAIGCWALGQRHRAVTGCAAGALAFAAAFVATHPSPLAMRDVWHVLFFALPLLSMSGLPLPEDRPRDEREHRYDPAVDRQHE